MSKHIIKRHVQTSIVARIIYRLICIVFIVVGFGGLFVASGVMDKYAAYGKRDRTTTAKVVGTNSSTDEYNYKDCDIEYEFTINSKKYSSKTSWESEPDNYNCNTGKDKTIAIRYEASNPSNNAYGDNVRERELIKAFGIGILLLSVLPLGVGFVGLVAIHKAVKEERANLAADAAAESKAKRSYRRHAKSPKTNDTTEE